MEDPCKLSFSGSEEENVHHCNADIEGDWIVFRCPHCREYERRIHMKTRQMLVSGNENNPYLHTGTYSNRLLVQAMNN
ncbi:MAG: hypothetical protein KatS3mg029_0849 [Saprospiraceae bacterium]|nr:MAG: hypothetical protein KatS3mg029_0849 [Saprospiraceae bacterium]